MTTQQGCGAGPRRPFGARSALRAEDLRAGERPDGLPPLRRSLAPSAPAKVAFARGRAGSLFARYRELVALFGRPVAGPTARERSRSQWLRPQRPPGRPSEFLGPLTPEIPSLSAGSVGRCDLRSQLDRRRAAGAAPHLAPLGPASDGPPGRPRPAPRRGQAGIRRRGQGRPSGRPPRSAGTPNPTDRGASRRPRRPSVITSGGGNAVGRT